MAPPDDPARGAGAAPDRPVYLPAEVEALADGDAAAARRRRRSLAVLWRLLPLLRPHRGRFAIAVIALLFGSGMTLAYPQGLRYGIREISENRSLAELNGLVGIAVAVFMVHAGFIWVRHYMMSWLGERVVADLRGMVFDRVLTLPVGWFHERRTGELVGRLASDVTVVEGVVGSDLSISLRNTVQLIGGLILLFIVNWKLTLLMLAVVPPIVIAGVGFGRVIRKMSRAVQDSLAEASGQVQESIGGIQTVQSFVREEREGRLYRRGVEHAFQQFLHLARWRSSFFATVTVAGYIGIAIVVWMGAREVIRGQLTAADLLAFLLYTALVASAIGDITNLYGALQRAAGATERLFAIVDTVPAIRDPDGALPLPPPGPAGGGHLRFDSVDFRYPSRPKHPVLSGLDLEVQPGQTVALVGPSGAGKSTIIQLLFRFYDVDAGAVRVEGVDVRSLRLAELRRALALVAQEPVLFSGSIRDNISYARDDASQEQIEQAARDARAHGFITGFPDGYDTIIGERGVKLSGGQKQRIAIARALLADPRVLVLDEATSNLDAESEALVQEALLRLMKNRTTLVVAHRLSTVRNADRIVVVDGGRITEQGRHEALMALNGTYRRLVERQIIQDV
jgi:ABC transporter fused permease/ATP-binding protein